MTLPSKSPITLAFGATTAPYSPSSPHEGTDFAYIPDNQIYAPFSGRVTLVPNNGRDGNGLYMTEPNGNFHGMLHSSKYLIANQSQVTEGQPIAIMGETGYAFGVHLHWCVKVNGQFIDPMTLIKPKGNTMFPNQGDLTNFYNRTGWPGHAPNVNDIAYWTTGTGNDGWAAGADNVWKDLAYSVTLYVLDNPAKTTPPTELKPGVYKVG